MSFNYEESVWGKGTASLKPVAPSAIRLKESLNALSGLSGGAKILEVGCGAGQFIRAIKQKRSDLLCYGCDISVAAIVSAQAQNDKVIYEISSVDYLPYPDHFCDAILIYDVLEHAPDYKILLKEMKRVLNPGGLVYCYVPCEDDWLSVWHYLNNWEQFKDLTNKYAGHVNRFSRKIWRKIFINSGLRVVKIRYSEHLIGQLLGVMVFSAMDKQAIKNPGQQINNEQFFNALNKQQGSWFGFFKKLVNILIYLESRLFRLLPSPNAHFVLKK